MSSNRTIKNIINAQKVSMGPHTILQPLPSHHLDQIDPFLLIHHWKHTFPGGQRQKEIGVGPHPHRGFSPITFIYEGDLEHRDSLGNRACIGKGGTQWMHAGRGITHSERPSKDIAENGGTVEFIQFWVNSPAAHKMDTPYYLALKNDQTPIRHGDGYQIQVVAGKYKDITGPAKTLSNQLLLRVSISKSKKLELNIPSDYNGLIYLLDGKLSIESKRIGAQQMAQLNNDGSHLFIECIENCRFILLAGSPLHEKKASYGPFVMNKQTEILEALRDAQQGKMGILIEEFD